MLTGDHVEWQRILDSVHRGLSHSLNGRVQGIRGILEVMAIRGGMDEELKALLEDEVARLQQLAEAARALPPASSTRPAVSVQNAIDAAIAINRLRHQGTILVSKRRSAHVVVSDEGELIRCLLMLFAAVESTLPPRERGKLEIVEDATDRAVVLLVRMTGVAQLQPADAAVLDAARRSAAVLKGTITELGPNGVELHLRADTST